VYPAVTLKNAEMSFNFGATPFRYPPQVPFVGVSVWELAAGKRSICAGTRSWLIPRRI